MQTTKSLSWGAYRHNVFRFPLMMVMAAIQVVHDYFCRLKACAHFFSTSPSQWLRAKK